MKTRIKETLFGIVLTLVILGSSALPSNAQSLPTITPSPLPSVGPLPAQPSGAQETYDAKLIEQVMYVVELSRLIDGGIMQALASALSTQKIITSLKDAVYGTRTFPVGNGPDEITAREGGTSILDMVDAALTGASVGPSDVDDAFTDYEANYKLDEPIGFVTDSSFNKVLVAHMAAQGAVAASTADSSYKRSNESMGRIDGYIQALEASVDLKTSLDINTRVNIEVAQQLNEMLRTQAALTTLAGFHYMSAASANAEISGNFNIEKYGR